MTANTAQRVAPATPRPRKTAPVKKTVERDSQGSLQRMLGLLDMFTLATPVRPVSDLVEYLGTSRSTSYRYIKALHESGLIEAVSSGHYTLGPRIVEFDRQIRMSDPMYKAGAAVLAELVETTGHSALLCALYSDSVMCIREQLVEGHPANLFSRGQRRPLFAGAAAKIILPYLPAHRLRSMFDAHRQAISNAGLGDEWTSFRDKLAAIRKDGYVVSYGEFNPGVFGVSAPVLNRDGLVIGSIGIAGLEKRLVRKKLPALAEAVIAAGSALTQSLADADGHLTRPPRAVGSTARREP